MTDNAKQQQVWFITGAGRGMGVDIARAALAAGHAVVATGRNAGASHRGARRRTTTCWPSRSTSPTPPHAEAAVQAAVDRFGRIDVLVNNAGNFYAGFFEELSPEDFRAQIETTLFGPVNVTRAALPLMRAQRSGLVVTISSTAGITAAGTSVSRLRRVEVRRRGLDGVPGPRGRAVRHPHDARRARLLPHRAAHARVDAVRRALDRGLRRAHRADRHGLEEHERPAGRRPRQARRRPGPAREPRRAAAALRRRRRRRRDLRAEGPRPCSPRPTPTASCPATSPTTTPDRTSTAREGTHITCSSS